MKSILILLFVFGIFSVVFGAQTSVQVDVYGRPIRNKGSVSHDHGTSGSGTGQIRITHNDHDGRQDRTEIHLSGVGHSGTGGNTRSTTEVRGSLRNGQIVAYSTGISVPEYISGSIKLY